MVQFRICLLLAALCACCGLGLTEVVTTKKPDLIPVPPHVEISANPEPVKENTVPATTEEEQTETTILDTSSAPASTPASTHASSPAPAPAPNTTTSPAPSNTTTPAPKTTTTPAPTPAPTPGPLPAPEQGKWAYTNETNNVTCIIVEFAAQLNVTYTKVVDNVTSLAYVVFNVPPQAEVVGGSCDGDEQLITLAWPYRNSSIANTITLTYHKNDTLKSYGLKNIDFALTPEMFVNASSKAVVQLNHGADWQTPYATSYRCEAPTRLNMTGDTASGAAAGLTFSKLQEEAFRTINGTGFSAARDCGGGDIPDAVPIAVGCALGGLVVVVLVAYLVGRRRSAARGYVSM